MTPTDPAEQIVTIATYAIFGIAYGVAGYVATLSRSDKDDASRVFKKRKLLTTVVVGAIAGVIVALRGGEATSEAFAAASAVAVPIADKLLNSILPEIYGGSRPASESTSTTSNKSGRGPL